MQEYRGEVQGVDMEETRLGGSESVAGVSQYTQDTPQPKHYVGWLSLSCEGNKPLHSASGRPLALNAFVSNMFGKKNFTSRYNHRSYAFSS